MADAVMNLVSQVVAYGDQPPTSQPSLRHVDWIRSIQGLEIKNPRSESVTIDPSSTLTVFDGSRTLGVNGSTDFLLEAASVPGEDSRYRLTWQGAGTSPAFRTDRAIDCTGATVAWDVDGQTATAELTSSQAGEFTAVVVGDVVFVPGQSTGDDPSPFDPANEGEWRVIGKPDNQTLVVARPQGADFSGADDSAVPAAAGELRAWSVAGVQVDDKMTISAGFPAAVQTTFSLVHIRPDLVEFRSTQPMPVGVSAVPGVAGIDVYTRGKRYVRVEVDQECLVRLNGDAGSTQRVQPWVVGDPSLPGEYSKVGPAWSMDLVNLAAVPMNAVVITAE